VAQKDLAANTQPHKLGNSFDFPTTKLLGILSVTDVRILEVLTPRPENALPSGQRQLPAQHHSHLMLK